MDFFYSLIIVSFSLSIFLFISFNFLYKKLNFYIEKINEIERLNEQALGIIQRLKEDVSECMQVTDYTQQDQKSLNEDFNVPVTKKHRQMCVFKSNTPRRPDYFIKPEDARRWVEWLEEHRENSVYWRLAIFMLLTGARVGKACGLKWSEVSLEEGVARVIRRVRWDQKTKHPFLEDVTKTSQSARLLMLPEKLKDVLKEMKKEAVNDLVFTDNKGELLKYNAVQALLKYKKYSNFNRIKNKWWRE